MVDQETRDSHGQGGGGWTVGKYRAEVGYRTHGKKRRVEKEGEKQDRR